MPHRFSLAFESKVAEVDAAQARLSTFTQRLTFAKRRVETIQGAALLKGDGVIAVHISGKEKYVTMFLFFRFDHEEGGSTESPAGQ